jgi:DNA polymerase
MTLALANAYPAELELLAQALGLPYQKDIEGIRLMRAMSRPRKPHKGEDKSVLHWLFDLDKLRRLVRYGQRDTQLTRMVWRHPKLKPLIEPERRIQVLDAVINRRGVQADRIFAIAARDMAERERKRINTAMAELTEGDIGSIDQVALIKALVNAQGHNMTTLNKRSVSAVLAGEPSDKVRRLLELRRDGARASTRKYQRILTCIGTDDRIRGSMRMYGAGPGRWSGRGAQLQNLKKNESGTPFAAIEAVLAGDRERLKAFGNPLSVLGDIARAVVCAGPGNVLMAADFGAIESRILAWLANEGWKLEAYRRYDATGDKTVEPYRIIAAQMLHKPVQEITKAERNIGKAGELACGFGGSVGAWRRIANDDTRSDEEIAADVRAWRQAHPKTVAFWHELARAIRVAIRTGQPMAAGRIVAGFTDGNLTLTLPSGRRITYPEARLVPSKFEDGPPDVQFKDNARGKWTDYRGWFGTFAENVVQGTARGLLASALERFEARGISVVLTVHDEVVAEVPIGAISEAEFLAILLEPPAWSNGLPLAGKVWSGSHYLEPPEEPESAAPTSPSTSGDGGIRLGEQPQTVELDAAIDAVIDATITGGVLEDEEDDLPPLFALVSVPLTANFKTNCPFHPDDTPSLQFYADHFFCFACQARGNRLDWLMRGEGMSEDEAAATIAAWDGFIPPPRPAEDPEEKRQRAMALWEHGVPIFGTLAERYLVETRGIDVDQLPADIGASLRFHAHCPFGSGQIHPCLLALMREPVSDVPVGIQRTGLELRGNRVCKIDRLALGRMGVIKLWPAGSRLVVGEGLETTLAAATRIPYGGTPLRPAWAAVSTNGMRKLPLIAGVEHLIILVDHDIEGQAAAKRCMERWSGANRQVLRLTPKRAGTDFNDLIMPKREEATL